VCAGRGVVRAEKRPAGHAAALRFGHTGAAGQVAMGEPPVQVREKTSEIFGLFFDQFLVNT